MLLRYPWRGFLAVVLFSLAGAQAEPGSGQALLPPTLQQSIDEAWANNLALGREEIEIALAASRLAEVKSWLQPRLDLVGRYTRADGGRTIDLPLGDLLNGAYGTLNDYLVSQGRPPTFPTLQNQEIPLLRSEEQETKLRLTQVLWRPELTRQSRASRLSLGAREAQVAAYRRELAHWVATAYLQAEAAEAGCRVWRNGLELATEAVRVNEVLLAHDKVTEDAVLRAQADLLRLRDQLAAAESDRAAARRQVNFLLNRPLDREVLPLPESELTFSIQSFTTMSGPRPALGRRDEIVALEGAVAAAAAQEDATRAREQPNLALVVEGGVQGESYRADRKASFVQGSLVAEVNLWDGRRHRQQARQAGLVRRQYELQLEQVRLQLELQWARAWDDLEVARAGLATAEGRAKAAARTFELVQKRERAGTANQLAYLDAQQEHIAASLQAAIARYRLLIAASAVQFTRGTFPTVNH